MAAIHDTAALGTLVKARRNSLGLRQQDLALAANVGVRFIVDLENGKATCQVGLVLRLLQALGIELEASMAPAPTAHEAQGDAEIFDPDRLGRAP